MNQEIANQFDVEIKAYEKALNDNNESAIRAHLARAHILSQVNTLMHLKVHYFMFKYACHKKDMKEVSGQLIRLLVTIPGHIFGKVPQGNIGWSNVGLTQEMPIPEDLGKILK